MSAERQVICPVDPVDDARDRDLDAEANELEALRQKVERDLDRWKRAQAAYENLKREAAREVHASVEQFQRDVLRDLRDMAGDFEHAERESPGGEVGDDPWRQGVELISRKLRALLAKQQVARTDTEDQPTEPELHKGVDQMPDQEDEITAPEKPDQLTEPTEPADPNE